MDKDIPARADEPSLHADRREDPAETLGRRENWVPLFAVTAVALAALGAVLLPARAKHDGESSPAVAASPAPRQVAASAGSANVVKAPPLAAQRPRAGAQAMGAAAACPNCGVVENVVAVHGRAGGKVEAVGFLMNIRMDDGTSRTVENRGALAAGSRVVVEGESVRALGRAI